jgi:hypothetical protein
MMAATSDHGLDRYRSGCRCEVYKQANRDYMRTYRAERRGLGEPPPQPDSTDASVSRLSAPVLVEDVAPDPIEAAVLAETGTLLGAARRPTSVQLALARDRRSAVRF